MRVTATAVTFNVDDVQASSRFLIDHFGFLEKFTTEDLASMAREDVTIDVVFLRRGMDVLPEDQRETHAAGMILAFTVEDLEGELARLEAEGVTITMPFTVDPWGERSFQVRDPNGVGPQLRHRRRHTRRWRPRRTGPRSESLATATNDTI